MMTPPSTGSFRAATPMIHVPDVSATAAWYEDIGFTVAERYGNGRVDVFEGLHDTFYGMREFIIRDLNRFWITFGQEVIKP